MNMTSQFFSVIVLHLGSLFLLSGAGKLISLPSFRQAFLAYDVLPIRLSIFAAYSIPAIEVTAALFLLFHETRMVGMVLITILLLVFLIGVRKILQSEKQVSCNCYGKWLDSDVDGFTLWKIIYLGCIVLTGGFLFPHADFHLYPFAIGAGITYTILLLGAQKTWQYHREMMEQLKRP
ncbi:MAG: hypothetical protein LRY73_19485 [Bacillus sp. (in: Bacteria)]|nr:hypothetical protein [Bacillus sp. (in: firmicutes)]